MKKGNVVVVVEDRQIIALCLQGDTEKYALLVERYQRLACAVAYQLLRNRQDAEDVAQEAFVKVYSKLQATRDMQFLPYLKTTITHLCWDKLRRSRTATKHLELASEDDVVDFCSPETEVLNSVRQATLRQAMEALPVMYREVLTLHYVSEQSYEQIASLLDQPMSIVKNRIFRGKKILKDLYIKLEGGMALEV